MFVLVLEWTMILLHYEHMAIFKHHTVRSAPHKNGNGSENEINNKYRYQIQDGNLLEHVTAASMGWSAGDGK
jgi:hypothetical protein